MTVSALAVQLCRRNNMSSVAAYSAAWRILNEYPPELRSAAEAWAENRDLPEVSVNDISLSLVINNTGENVPAALELLYVISKDPDNGIELLCLCTKHDSFR